MFCIQWIITTNLNNELGFVPEFGLLIDHCKKRMTMSIYLNLDKLI